MLPMQNYRDWEAFLKKMKRSGAFQRASRHLRAETLAVGADFYFQSYRHSDQPSHLPRALALWTQAMDLVPVTDPHWKPYGQYNYLLALWDQCQQRPSKELVARGLTLSSHLLTDARTSTADRRVIEILSSCFSLKKFETAASVADLAKAFDILICCEAKQPGSDNHFARASDQTARKLNGARDQLLDWPGLKTWLCANWQHLAALQPEHHVIGIVLMAEELLKLTCEFGDIPASVLGTARRIFDNAPEDWRAAAAGHAFLVLGMTAKTRHAMYQEDDDLDCAIDAFERAIASADLPNDSKAGAALNLANSLLARFAHRPAEAHLDRMVEAAELAERLSGSDTASQREAVRTKRITKLFRDTLRGTLVALPEAELQQTIADILRSTDPEGRCADIELLGGLALAVGCLFEENKQLDLLERAVAIASLTYSQALAFHCDKHMAVIAYARTLLSRYDWTRDDLDLDNALLALRSVDPNTAPIKSTRVALHHSLADALHFDVSRTANWDLLDEVKEHYQASLALSRDPQMQIYYQEKLASTLFHKARTVGSDEDARHALELLEDAWQRNSDPKLTGHLANRYGTSLLKFVESTSDRPAFDKAIELLAISHENTAATSIEYPIVAAALIYAYQRRFESFGDPDDLRRSIAVGEAALIVLAQRKLPDIRYQIGDQAVWYRVHESLVEAYMSQAKIEDRVAATRRAFEVAESAKGGLLLGLFGNGETDPAKLASMFREESAPPAMITQIARAAYGAPLLRSQGETTPARDSVLMNWGTAVSLLRQFGPETAILSCFLGQRRCWWFLLSSNSVAPLVVEAELGRPDWLEILRRVLNELMLSPSQARADESWFAGLSSLADLSTELRSFRHLIISNHQMTSYLAWNVLSRRLQWHSNDERAMSISTVPNLGFLARPLESRLASLPPVVIGDPLNDLAYAAAEARAVAEVFGVEPLLGADATLQAVTQDLGSRLLIHFACHGELFQGRDPVALRLANGTLSARDILKTRMSAKLVVLSACWSGITSRASREEYFGLAEAFLLAGVDSVVAALWEVNDEVSSEFFRQFYRAWQNHLAAADALRDAMETISSQSKWAHPHWWGGFVVRGFGGYDRSASKFG